jgi:hypothetical protein
MIHPSIILLTTAFDALIRDMTEREDDLVSQNADPRQIVQYYQQALPRLDDAFRIAMMYASPDLMLRFQHDYLALRKSLFNHLVQAQLALANPSSSQ